MLTRQGKIVTFYSFKGGVGRTMALANTAFLAATNGLRVLVMDWDLEAPGVAYYFRGLLNPQQGVALKDAPGLLNVLWDWNFATQNQSVEELTRTLSQFDEGSPFKELVLNLMPPEHLPEGGALDYLSAGSRKIGSGVEQVPYEQALAEFSWTKFFENQAGGAVLSGLRKWCQGAYDVVLIDSRTGLADVAGICTMQLPDQVVLCFVLNRQNIDGIARVALAIRQNRNEQVSIRAIPMRTAREGTSEESDARARAFSELTRVGGFSQEALVEDFKLSVRSTEGVPFYETIAPLLPQVPAIEVFSTNYRQLASDILGQALKLPELDIEWMEIVRRRLQPRRVTVEYIQELENAEPLRATAELHRLLESAFEEALDGNVDQVYVEALVGAAWVIPDEMNSDGQDLGVIERTLDLLRWLRLEYGTDWTLKLLEGLERYWSGAAHLLELDQQLAVLEEIDSLLAESNTLASKLTRLEYRCIAARVHQAVLDPNVTREVLSEGWSLSELIKQGYELAPDQAESLAMHETELHRVEAEFKLRQDDASGAIESLKKAVNTLSRVSADASRTDATRLRFLVATRLSALLRQSNRSSEAANWSIRAAEAANNGRNFVGTYFIALVSSILDAADPKQALEFCQLVFLRDPSRSIASISATSARMPRSAIDLMQSLGGLAELVLRTKAPTVADIRKALAQTAKQALANISRRNGVMTAAQINEITQAVNQYCRSLDASDIDSDADWDELLDGLRRSSAAGTTRRSS